MEENRKLTKKEKKELRKFEWQEKAKKEQKNAMIKKYSIWTGAVLTIVLIIAGLVWLASSPSSTSDTGQKVNVAEITSKDITKGDKNAKVTLIEYADFQCPACASYNSLVNQLITDYGNKILFVYRMFPLTNIHPNAHISAQAAYAAHKQGQFFEYDDLLYSNQTDWASNSDPRVAFAAYAVKLKLDLKKFQTDMNSDEAKNYVNDSEKIAQSEGINSTPTFILNGVKIQNPRAYEEFKKLIDDELNKTK